MLIQTEFQGSGFTMVPNHVAESLGADALGVLVWLSVRPVGSTLSVVSICKRFGFGKDKWQRISRELREAGALLATTLQCPETGRMIGKSFLVRWPEKKKTHKPENPALGASPKAGKPGKSAPENPAPIKEERYKKGRNPCGRSSGSQAERASQLLPSLSPFARSQIEQGKLLILPGREACPVGSPLHDALRAALLAERSECKE